MEFINPWIFILFCATMTTLFTFLMTFIFITIFFVIVTICSTSTPFIFTNFMFYIIFLLVVSLRLLLLLTTTRFVVITLLFFLLINIFVFLNRLFFWCLWNCSLRSVLLLLLLLWSVALLLCFRVNLIAHWRYLNKLTNKILQFK